MDPQKQNTETKQSMSLEAACILQNWGNSAPSDPPQARRYSNRCSLQQCRRHQQSIQETVVPGQRDMSIHQPGLVLSWPAQNSGLCSPARKHSVKERANQGPTQCVSFS